MKKHDNSVILFSSALLIALFFINITPLFQNNAYGKVINEENIVTSFDIANEGFAKLYDEASPEFIYPLYGTVTSAFNDISDRKTAHKGIDIAAKKGTEVKSSIDGIVDKAYYSKTYGWCISVRDQNTETIYAHNDKLLAEKGDKVYQGDVIALSGNTGDSTGPHLHFEIIIDGKHYDPAILCK